MRPLGDIPSEGLRRLRGVFADIDDTLTSDGRIVVEAFAGLAALKDAGLIIAPITGRPAGWCDHIARMWPVDGVVGENGAFYFRYEPRQRRLIRRFMQGAAERQRARGRLRAIAEQIVAAVPGSAVAADQLYREADLAIDYCEDVAPLPREAVDRIVALMAAEGLTAKVSSIHVNGWFGSYDKLAMTRIMLSECFAVDLDAEREHFAFVGDSPNDSPMFGFFPLSVGVANVADFAERLSPPPAFVTTKRGGAGFAEFASRLIAARST